MSRVYVRRVVEEISEGLIRTTPVEDMRRWLEPTWGNRFHEMYGAVIASMQGLSASQADQLVRDLNLHGWFPSLIGDDEESTVFTPVVLKQWVESGTEFEIKFEAKFDPKVSEVAVEYWHAAPTSRASKIATRGLGPRTNAKLGQHPDRVYLTSSRLAAEKIARQLARISGEKSYTLFRINPRVREAGQPIALYHDPNWSHGVYTYDVIPPQALERGPTIDVDETSKPAPIP